MSKPANNLYEFGPFRLDVANQELLLEGEPVPLQKKAFDTLVFLVQHNREVLAKEELMQALWPDSFVEESNLTQNIYMLRKALKGGMGETQYIATVPGRGYRFTASVREVVDEEETLVVEDHTVSHIVITEREEAGPAQLLTAGESAIEVAATTVPEVPQSAQYLIEGETRDPGKRMIALAAMVCLAVGGVAFGIYQFRNRSAATPPAAPARIAPFTSFPGSELDPAFSPDGNRIAFAWDGGQDGGLNIYVKQLGEGDPLRLTTNAADDRSPVWSPDSRYIAFIRYSPDRGGIFMVPALGGAERKLAEPATVLSQELKFSNVKSIGQISLSNLAWFPDGKAIAFVDRATPEERNSIYVLSIDTGEKRRLTWSGTSSDNFPALSPDGKTLAFIRKPPTASNAIYVVPGAGGEPTRLTWDNRDVYGLTWSADGSEILFLSAREGGGRTLWRMPATGGKPELVPAVTGQLSSPAIAPQGGRLAYVESSTDINIWRLQGPGLTGQDPASNKPLSTKLIGSTRQDHSPQFSPDGKKIVFVSDRSGCNEIWLCDQDGAHSRQLTNCLGGSNGTPRWSPDGLQIVYDSNSEGQRPMFVISAEGGTPRPLGSAATQGSAPSWSRDGRWIYFSSLRSGSSEMWKVPASGGDAVQVTRQGGFEGFESPDGQTLYYTKGRGPGGIWQVPVDGGAEAQVPELSQAGYWRYWAVLDRGIYFVSHEETGAPIIKFFDFATRLVTPLATVEKEPLWWTPGLAVSPDGTALLYTQGDQLGSDILLVENFR